MSEQEPESKPEQVSIRWLHICQAGVEDFALASILMGAIANVPGLTEDEAAMFNKASDRSAKFVMQEVGRVVYEEALSFASDRFNETIREAKVLAGDA